MSFSLKKIREGQNISQEFLANKLGISRPTYSQIENGNRELTLKEAQSLAKLFNMSLEDFIEGKENNSPKMTIKFEKPKPKAPKQEIRISVPQESVEKFKEVFIYILEKIGARPNIGEVVIWKLMYFIDFDYYEKYEEQLIGAKYIKNTHGPTPAAYAQIIEQMIKNQELTLVKNKYFQYQQKKYLPLRSANLSIFSAQEKELIDHEIERFKDYNATKISELSHRDVPWIGTKDKQIIDYEAVFARTDELSIRKYNDELC